MCNIDPAGYRIDARDLLREPKRRLRSRSRDLIRIGGEGKGGARPLEWETGRKLAPRTRLYSLNYVSPANYPNEYSTSGLGGLDIAAYLSAVASNIGMYVYAFATGM